MNSTRKGSEAPLCQRAAISRALILLFLCCCYRPAVAQTAIHYADTWLYNVPLNNPGTSWTGPNFDVSTALNGVAWRSGNGLMGFETAVLPAPGIQTSVGTSGSANITYLFRKAFYFDGNPRNATLALDQIVDDGVTYYLNGTIVGSVRHTPGEWNNLAANVGDAVEELNVINGPATGLVYGNNVLSAEVHQSGASSTDLVFGARLKFSGAELGSDEWRQLNFGSSANMGTGADGADPDNDGFPNLTEFALATNPLKPSSGGWTVRAEGANLTITYTRRRSALAEATFACIQANSLTGPWTTSAVTEQILSDDGSLQTVKATAPVTGANLFSKIQVTRLPISLPAAPGALTATAASENRIDLQWSDLSNNETQFKIESKTGANGAYTQIGSVGPNVTAFSSAGLTSGITYYYRVCANNSAGNSTFTTEKSATTLSPPAAPGGLVASVISGTQINLQWVDNSGNESGFKIERRMSGSGNSFAEIATRGINITTFSDTGVSAGAVYIYRVRATNSVGDSSYTADCRTGTVVPADPSNTAVLVTNATTIAVSWADNSNNESGFKIERRISNGNHTQIGAVGAGITTFNDSTGTAGVTYIYQVRAYNPIGNSNSSPEARTSAGAPSAPTNLVAAVATSTQNTLTWSSSSDNETGFKIERRQSGNGVFTDLGTVPANSTSCADITAASGTTYIYRVAAVNAAGNSSYTTDARITTGVPLTPSGLIATVISASQINLSWTDNSNSEVAYQIERRTSSGTFTQVGSMPADTTTYQDANLAFSTTYVYRVKCTNAVGNSIYSNESTATTPAAPPAPTGFTVRRALGGNGSISYTIDIIAVNQANGTVKLRDTSTVPVPAGYQKYYIINDRQYQGELENFGAFQPYMNVTITKVIAQGPEFWRWDTSNPNNHYIRPDLMGGAEVFTGTR